MTSIFMRKIPVAVPFFNNKTQLCIELKNKNKKN